VCVEKVRCPDTKTKGMIPKKPVATPGGGLFILSNIQRTAALYDTDAIV
jgi:hypothetical protein